MNWTPIPGTSEHLRVCEQPRIDFFLINTKCQFLAAKQQLYILRNDSLTDSLTDFQTVS